MKSLKHTGGFTLIELMIVVVIVAVLAAVAYPSYQDSVRKGRRSAAQAFLMEAANKQQQYLTDTRSYALGAGFLGSPGLNITAPSDVTKFYTLTVLPAAATTPPSFTLVATPIAGGPQVVDGELTLTNLGAKARKVGGVDPDLGW